MARIFNYSFFNANIFLQWLSQLSINDYKILTIIWNIILALIPLAAYLILKKHWRQTQIASFYHKIVAVLLLIIWLLFFPNTAYLLTDIRHLMDYCPADSPYKVCPGNAWMIIFFFSYASLGWLLFYYILKAMSSLINDICNKIHSNIFIIAMIPLASLGVMLGLLNRFNSLDMFLFPDQILRAASFYFSKKDYFFNWFIFTIFLYLLYFIGDAVFRKIDRESFRGLCKRNKR